MEIENNYFKNSYNNFHRLNNVLLSLHNFIIVMRMEFIIYVKILKVL